MAEVEKVADEPPPEPPPSKAGGGRAARAGRWTGAVALMVVALVLSITSIAAVFARNQLLNTDRYVATMAPLATDPVIQAAISNRISEEVLARVDLKSLATQATEWLTSRGAPDALKTLVGPAVNAVESFVRSEISKIVHSNQFATIWNAANRAGHRALVAILTGSKNGAIVSSGDTVSINLGPLLANVKQRLIADGFGLASKIPAVSAQFTIFESNKLPKLRSTVRLLNDVATWLPWVTLAIIVGAVFTAPNRRRGIILAGLFIALGLLITRGVIHFIAESAIDDLPPTVQSPEAVQHVLTIVLRNVRVAVNFFALIFGLAAVFAFLFGTNRFSTGLRKLINMALDGIGRALGASGIPLGPVPAFVRQYRRIAAPLAIAIAVVVLVFNPSVANVLWSVFWVLLALAIVEILARTEKPAVTAPALA
jgi:hypothetical protein